MCIFMHTHTHTREFLIISGCHNLNPMSCWGSMEQKEGRLEGWWTNPGYSPFLLRSGLYRASLWGGQEHYSQHHPSLG